MPPLLYHAVLERQSINIAVNIHLYDLFSYAYSIFFQIISNAFYVVALKRSQSLLAPHLFCSSSTIV